MTFAPWDCASMLQISPSTISKFVAFRGAKLLEFGIPNLYKWRVSESSRKLQKTMWKIKNIYECFIFFFSFEKPRQARHGMAKLLIYDRPLAFFLLVVFSLSWQDSGAGERTEKDFLVFHSSKYDFCKFARCSEFSVEQIWGENSRSNFLFG